MLSPIMLPSPGARLSRMSIVDYYYGVQFMQHTLNPPKIRDQRSLHSRVFLISIGQRGRGFFIAVAAQHRQLPK